MARPRLFEEMLNLQIGQKLSFTPHPGESLEKAEARIKKQASRFRSEGLSYAVWAESGLIYVERTKFGQNKKLRSWEDLKAGERLLLKTNATNEDLRSAQQTAQFLNNKPKICGEWRAYIQMGNLYVSRNGDIEMIHQHSTGVKRLPDQSEREYLCALIGGYRSHIDSLIKKIVKQSEFDAKVSGLEIAECEAEISEIEDQIAEIDGDLSHLRKG